jgi:hypothetical protein
LSCSERRIASLIAVGVVLIAAGGLSGADKHVQAGLALVSVFVPFRRDGERHGGRRFYKLVFTGEQCVTPTNRPGEALTAAPVIRSGRPLTWLLLCLTHHPLRASSDAGLAARWPRQVTLAA